MISYKDIKKFVESNIEEHNLKTYRCTGRNMYVTIYDISPTRYLAITLYKGGDKYYVCIDILGCMHRLVWPLSDRNFIIISKHCRMKKIRGIKALKIFLFAIIDYNKNILKIKYGLK